MHDSYIYTFDWNYCLGCQAISQSVRSLYPRRVIQSVSCDSIPWKWGVYSSLENTKCLGKTDCKDSIWRRWTTKMYRQPAASSWIGWTFGRDWSPSFLRWMCLCRSQRLQRKYKAFLECFTETYPSGRYNYICFSHMFSTTHSSVTPQSILADAQQICNEQGWGSEELLQMESILCKTMAEPLCLSPNPLLGELAVNHDSASKQMHSSVLKQSRRTWCESRKRKQSESFSSNEFRLHDFLKKKSLLGRGIPPILQVWLF